MSSMPCARRYENSERSDTFTGVEGERALPSQRISPGSISNTRGFVMTLSERRLVVAAVRLVATPQPDYHRESTRYVRTGKGGRQ